jgi:hypothetical protein
MQWVYVAGELQMRVRALFPQLATAQAEVFPPSRYCGGSKAEEHVTSLPVEVVGNSAKASRPIID